MIMFALLSPETLVACTTKEGVLLTKYAGATADNFNGIG